MGYEVTIKKPQCIDSKFTSIYTNSYKLSKDLADIKNELIVFCLKDHSQEQIRDAIFRLRLLVEYLSRMIEDKTKLDIHETFEIEGEITFCGWEYSRESDFERNDIIENVIKMLSILSLAVPTPDYCNDHDSWVNKLSNIESEIEYLDSLSDIIQHDLIDTYYREENEEIDEE